MIKFITKIFLFSVFPILSFLAVISIEDGKTDHFYNKVISSRKQSMIYGISKSEQGIMPSVLNEIIAGSDFYNFSFALSVSPYGKAYYESVKMKLDHTGSDAIHILTIDPWSVMGSKEDPENELLFEENENFLGTMPTVSLNPNFFYLKEYFSKPLYEVIRRLFEKGHFVLHPDGWKEIHASDDPQVRKDLTASTISTFRDKNENYAVSEKRFEYFEKTLNVLAEHGKVFVVRLPVNAEILELENFHNPRFELLLQKILTDNGFDYFDMTIHSTSDLKFIDGIHLDKPSAVVVSNQIADWILTIEASLAAKQVD